MARPHVGLPSHQGDIQKYATRFDLVELRPVDTSLPKTATLRAWRRNVPPGFVFSVVLPRVVAELRPTPELDTALEEALSVALAVEARCIVLHTPPSVTPTDLNRKRLAALLERLPHDAVTLAWEPTGLWEVPEAAIIASKLGVVVVVDPVREAPPKGPVAYLRLRGLGESARLGPAALDKVAASLLDRREAFVVIETVGAATIAAALRKRGLRKSVVKATSTVLRPRTTLHAEDEEQ